MKKAVWIILAEDCTQIRIKWTQGSLVPSYFFGTPMTAGTAATFKYMDSRKKGR